MRKESKDMKENLFDVDADLIGKATKNPFAVVARITFDDMTGHLGEFLRSAIRCGIVPEDFAADSKTASAIIQRNAKEKSRRANVADGFFNVAAGLIDRAEAPREGDNAATIEAAKNTARELGELYAAAAKNLEAAFTPPAVPQLREIATRHTFDPEAAAAAADVVLELALEAGIHVEPDEADVRALSRMTANNTAATEEEVRKLAEKHFGTRARITTDAYFERDTPATTRSFA